MNFNNLFLPVVVYHPCIVEQMNNQIIGVSIEDSHISAGLVDFSARKVIPGSLKRKRINNNGSADEIISAWAKTLNEVSLQNITEGDKIGIGMPGVFNYETGVLLQKINGGRYSGLYQQNLKELLASQLGIGQSCIRMLSDSASFLQGEIFGGAARGFGRSLGVTLGIGLGSAKYNDKVVENLQMYKMPFKDSIAEDYICLKWLFDRYEVLSGTRVNDRLDLNRLAETEPRALKVFEEFGQNLAEFLASFIRQSNTRPEVVVIGGHMETSYRFFFNKTIKCLHENGINFPVLRAVLGEEAGIIGAASLWYHEQPIHV